MLINVVQFSGGKDSTCMLLMMLERGMCVDKIIFCDTGMEFPQMYEHIKAVDDYIFKNYNKRIEIIKAEKDFNYWMFDHVKTKGANKGEKGYGWATMGQRWCTARLKVDPTKKYLKSIGEKNYRLFIGIAADEPQRIKEHCYPLYEWGITEKQALEYCYSKGFDWGGLYKIFNRVSCWCCPLQPIPELRKLRTLFPDLWQKLLDMETNQNYKFKFKPTYSVQELEERFAYEDIHGIQKKFKRSLTSSK